MIKLRNTLLSPEEVQVNLDSLYYKGFTLTNIRLGFLIYKQQSPARRATLIIQDVPLPNLKYPVYQKHYSNPSLHVAFAYTSSSKKPTQGSIKLLRDYYDHMIYEYTMWTIKGSLLAITIGLPLLLFQIVNPMIISTIFILVFLFVFYRTLVYFKFKRMVYQPLNILVNKKRASV